MKVSYQMSLRSPEEELLEGVGLAVPGPATISFSAERCRQRFCPGRPCARRLWSRSGTGGGTYLKRWPKTIDHGDVVEHRFTVLTSPNDPDMIVLRPDLVPDAAERRTPTSFAATRTGSCVMDTCMTRWKTLGPALIALSWTPCGKTWPASLPMGINGSMLSTRSTERTAGNWAGPTG